MARLRSALAAAVLGGLGGLILLVAESVLLLRGGAIGFSIDVEGPFAALFAAVRPYLPLLLGKLAAWYLGWGALLGLLAGALVQAVPVRRGGPRLLLWAAEWGVLLALACWHSAVLRPALFDDLPWGQGVLAYLVRHGEPWHAAAATGAFLAAHAASSLWRYPVRQVAWALGAGALVAVGIAAVGRPAFPSPSPQPLVVLVGIDAFRPDRLEALGGTGQVAPHLERFLEEATLFTRAYTPIGQTEPAWRSLLTGRWPHRTGVRYPLTAESRWEISPTFPALFAQAGYSTAFHTDCSRFHAEGPASGFATRFQPPRGAVNFLLEKLRYRGVGIFGANRLGAAVFPEMVDNRALAGIHDPWGYGDRLAKSLLGQAQQGKALFAFHATAAHFPGDPSFPFYRQGLDPSLPLDRRLRMVFAPIDRSAARTPGWTRQSAEGLYDELLSQADAQVGLLFDLLREAGLYDEALIVVFSDHGESFHADLPELEGATSVHGARLSDEENRILLAVKLPRSQRKAKVAREDGLVRLIDIGPTLLELSGLPALPGADGESFAAALAGQPLGGRRLYAETGYTHASPDAFDPGHLAVAPRSFTAFRIRPDGVVELSDEAHQAVLQEKDIGAFDGASWVIRSPRTDGSTLERCQGACADPGLSAWLDQVRQATP